MNTKLIFLTALAFCLFISCISHKPVSEETKHPGYFLTGKGKILSETGDSVKLKITIKNKARKTSYQNLDLLVQLKKKDGSASCSFGQNLQSVPVKPKRMQTMYYTLYCPNAEAHSVEFLNIYGEPVTLRK